MEVNYNTIHKTEIDIKQNTSFEFARDVILENINIDIEQARKKTFPFF